MCKGSETGKSWTYQGPEKDLQHLSGEWEGKEGMKQSDSCRPEPDNLESNKRSGLSKIFFFLRWEWKRMYLGYIVEMNG